MERDLFFEDKGIRDILDLYNHDLIEVYEKSYNTSYYRLYQSFLNKFTKIFKELKTFEDPSILDVGCAQGNFTKILAQLDYRVTSIDINPNYVKYTKSKTNQMSNVEVVCSNIYEYSPNKEFDFIFLGEVIEHVKEPEKLLKKLCELLKPQGSLIFTTPNQEYCRNKLPSFDSIDVSKIDEFFPDGDGHVFLYSENNLQDIISKVPTLKIHSSKRYRSLFLAGDLRIRTIHSIIPERLHFKIEDFIENAKLPTRFYSQLLYILQRVET